MRKQIPFFILLSLPFFAFAANTYTTTTIAEKSARAQKGYDRHGNQSTECKYTAYRFDPNIPSYVSIGINIDSDDNTYIHDNISFEEWDIPLRDGTIFLRDQESATYENGILKFQTQEGDGPFSVLITEIELKVSRDLKEISFINLKKTVRPLLGWKKVDTQLTCHF